MYIYIYSRSCVPSEICCMAPAARAQNTRSLFALPHVAENPLPTKMTPKLPLSNAQLWEGFHMQVMLKSFTGQYVSPTYGGEWSISKTTLQYAPLVVLPLKKTIFDGHPYLQRITPLPVEWLVERDWWVQTHWEDSDCRMIYRNLVACPILRDMISTARLYPGGRVKIIELKAIPPVTDPPVDVTIENCAVMLHRYLLTARELEISTTWSQVTTWCQPP